MREADRRAVSGRRVLRRAGQRRRRGYDYPREVRFEIAEQDLDGYRRAADFLNFSNTDVVCLQHEYGIYGGAGRQPHPRRCCATCGCRSSRRLHTVLREPNADQRRVMRATGRACPRAWSSCRSAAATFLREIYGVPEAKIDLIAHGIPDMPFVDPNFYKEQFGVEGKQVRADVRAALAEQGHRAHAPGAAGDPRGVSRLRLHRPRRDPPGPGARAGRSATG